jgi:hypothetical protein
MKKVAILAEKERDIFRRVLRREKFLVLNPDSQPDLHWEKIR